MRVDDGVAVCVADRKVADPAVEFARELAAQAAKFAAEVERLHARHPGPTARPARRRAGAGEAA